MNASRWPRVREGLRRDWKRLLWPSVRDGKQDPLEAQELIERATDLLVLAVPPELFEGLDRETTIRVALDRIVRRNKDSIKKPRDRVQEKSMGVDLDDLLRSLAFEKAQDAFGEGSWVLIGLSEKELRGLTRSWEHRIGDDIRGPGWRRKKEKAWPVDKKGNLLLQLGPSSVDLDLLEEMAVKQLREEIEEILTDRQSEVVGLWEEGYSHGEIAEKLGISEGRSAVVLSEARGRLRERMQDPRYP